MELFEDIQQQEGEHLLCEIGTLGRKLVELGWSRDRVRVYVTRVFNESMDTASGVPLSSRKED